MHAYYFIDGKIAINNFKTNVSLIFIHQHCRRKTDMGYNWNNSFACIGKDYHHIFLPILFLQINLAQYLIGNLNLLLNIHTCKDVTQLKVLIYCLMFRYIYTFYITWYLGS